MNKTFQVELSFKDALERQNEIHQMTRTKVSKLLSNLKFVAGTFGAFFVCYSLLVNRGATLTINGENYSLVAYFFSGLVAGLVGVCCGYIFFVLNQICQTSAKKKEAEKYIQSNENKYLLHLNGKSLRIERSKREDFLIHLNEIRATLPRANFVILRLGKERSAIVPRFPEENFDLWKHIEPLLKTRAEPVACSDDG